jgi:class 3 adenylate cyclase
VFLFSDIEGSTRLWEGAPDRMRVALERHDALLGRVVAEAGGTVFNHTGDGLACWFPTSAVAVTAAHRGQRELAGVPWSMDEPLRVRMAVHAGEADPRQGGWFGPALNRCARLVGIGHGGQVLVSGAARALLVDGLPAGLGLVGLGLHRLRDLAAPEDVFQLTGAGLGREFPPLRSLEAFRGNLPSQPTTFLGRGTEVDGLAAVLDVCRLVTAVGPGGMGKTRLALQAAAVVVDRFRDGAWFVELAPLADAAALDHALATTLHLRPEAGQSPGRRRSKPWRVGGP